MGSLADPETAGRLKVTAAENIFSSGSVLLFNSQARQEEGFISWAVG